MEGLGFGAPSRALFITRAVRELERLCTAVGGEARTAPGLGGLGDLLARMDAGSAHFRLGLAVDGKKELLQTGDEGLLPGLCKTAEAVAQLAKHSRTSAPIFIGLAELLAGRVSGRGLVERLMTLPVLND